MLQARVSLEQTYKTGLQNFYIIKKHKENIMCRNLDQ